MDPEGEETASPEADDQPAEPPPEKRAGPARSRDGYIRRVHPVAGFVLAGWVFGALEGALTPPSKSRALVILFAAVFGSIFGSLVGAVLWLASIGLRRIGPLRRAVARLAWLADGSEGRSDRLLTIYSFAASALVVSAVATAGASFLFARLFELQEQDLVRGLAVVVVSIVAIGGLIGSFFVGFALRRGARFLARKKWLPVPAPAWALYLAFVTLPLFLGIYPFMRKHGGMLGIVRDGTLVVLMIAAGVQGVLLLRRVPDRAARLVTSAVAAVALLAALLVGFSRRGPVVGAAELSPVASLGARAARFMTDVDRDGSSSMFGGLDCAPFNRARAPGRAEIPGNGVDEDCNGSDTTTTAALENAVRFSDALQPKQIKNYNVVWVIVETVRADHVSAIDYDRPTFPYLAKLAKESLLFTDAYSQSSGTVISIPSMLSGMDPGMAEWTRQRNHPQLLPQELLLAERLKAKGYNTGFVLDVYLKNNFLSIQRGFDQLLLAEPDNQNKNNRPRRNLFSTAKAAEFLARTKPDEPFFLVVYYPDPHAPYTRHKDVDNSKFEKSDLGDYDSELAFADQQIRALVEMLKARPSVWDKTIFVMNADHGEEFQEHGGVRHAISCHDEVLHVPLLMRIPGIAASRIDARVGLIDVVPTILEMLGARDDTSRLSGRSLLIPALRPEQVEATRPLFCTIPSITDKYGTFFRRAVRTGDYTLLQDVNEGTYSLFDAKTDRGEQRDLSQSPEHAATFDSLKQLLEVSRTGNLRDHTKMSRPERDQGDEEPE
ncbi:MAG: sulfatase-like hydrolase/transferase [Polyangiaceae bacterium]|nr:sulfatase-like hydrolase/transferase [Polyangiaceae bacterium]